MLQLKHLSSYIVSRIMGSRLPASVWTKPQIFSVQFAMDPHVFPSPSWGTRKMKYDPLFGGVFRATVTTSLVSMGVARKI